MTRGKVLIVDDSLTVRMNLADAFEAAGFVPLPCATLAEARDALRTGEPMAVILDVMLPDGDGVELLGEIRAWPGRETTPVLLLSSETEVADRVRGLRGGADDYVGKPYDTGYVVARAGELIRARAGGSTPTSPRLLVIDDSATFRAALVRELVAAGYDVTEAASGEEGLRLAASERPGAILVDSSMPGIDGATVIRRVRMDSALRATPCVLLTASDEAGAELRAFDAGADAFAQKGDDFAIVLARLAALLRGFTAESGTASLLAPKRILAVGDRSRLVDELRWGLQGEAYDVVRARSAEEAIEILATQSVDCVVLDRETTDEGGLEACRRVKASPGLGDVPLLVVDAAEDRQRVIESLAAGADDVIARGSDLDVLRARVRSQLRRKQIQDEHRQRCEELVRNEARAAEERAARLVAEAKAALVVELQRKNQELEAFSFSVSHDLRAPLRGIDGFSQILLEQYEDRLDATGRDYLRRVRAAAQRMGRLIDDMLDLSRVGRAELVRAPVDLSALAREVIDEIAKREPHREVTVAIEDGLLVEGDRALLEILLENVLGNAWKFTSKVAGARIEVGAFSDEAGITYFVRDNGAGFDMKRAARLFTPFQRLHVEAEFPGTGIGLATVQRIVSRHGGRVWAEGEVGRGATVRFTLNRAGALG